MNFSHGIFYNPGPLNVLIREYMQRNQSLPGLATFVKRLRVKTLHLKTKNKKGEDMIRVKTISGLATQNDGHGMEHRPKVAGFGAGPKYVLFWMDPAVGKGGFPGGGGKKGKGQGGKPLQPTGMGRYISAFDYFTQSESSNPSPRPSRQLTCTPHRTQPRG